MKKIENLPIGTVVKVGIEYSPLNDNHRIMTVIGYDSEPKEGFDKVYRVKELQDNESYNYILPKEIKRVISYPIDRDKLKCGVKVKVRDDLEIGECYGKLNWEIKRESVKGKVVEVKNFYPILDYIDVKGVEDFLLTPEMLESIIDEPEVVDGIEAWNQMKQGKYASDKDWLGKIVDGKLHETYKANDKSWKFVHSNVHLNQFMEGEYRILDELPDWAQEPVNPFKVGDIVTLEIENITGHTREVTEVINGEKFMTKEIDGGVWDWNVRTHRPATQEEELNYWKKRAKYLEYN